MTSRERMLGAIACQESDYVPCSFMLFKSLWDSCSSTTAFIERQVDMGLDASVPLGVLHRAFHPEADYSEWSEVVKPPR